MAGRWIRRVFYAASALVLGVALLAIAALVALGIPRNAAGMAAKGICSAAFVAERPLPQLLAEEVLPAVRCFRPSPCRSTGRAAA